MADDYEAEQAVIGTQWYQVLPFQNVDLFGSGDNVSSFQIVGKQLSPFGEGNLLRERKQVIRDWSTKNSIRNDAGYNNFESTNERTNEQ